MRNTEELKGIWQSSVTDKEAIDKMLQNGLIFTGEQGRRLCLLFRQKQDWCMLEEQDGFIRQVREEEMSSRPDGCNPATGGPFTPWYKTTGHFHLDDEGKVKGIHFHGIPAVGKNILQMALRSERCIEGGGVVLRMLTKMLETENI